MNSVSLLVPVTIISLFLSSSFFSSTYLPRFSSTFASPSYGFLCTSEALLPLMLPPDLKLKPICPEAATVERAREAVALPVPEREPCLGLGLAVEEGRGLEEYFSVDLGLLSLAFSSNCRAISIYILSLSALLCPWQPYERIENNAFSMNYLASSKRLRSYVMPATEMRV